MIRDEMTSEERLEALFKGEDLDRIPVVPFMLAHYAVVNGIPTADIFTNAEASYAAQIRGNELYGFDGYGRYGYAMFGSWEFGGEIVFPRKDGQAPVVTKLAADNEEDAMKLEVPEDILKAGSIPISLEVARIAAKQNAPVPIHLNAPFNVATCVVGIERLMMWMISSPDVVHHVLRKCTDLSLRLIDCWIKEFGAENIIATSGTAAESNGLISPTHFEQFALPYLKEMVEKLTEVGVGKLLIHICAEQNLNLPGYATIKWPNRTIFSLGPEIAIKDAANVFPGQIIGGHVDPLLIKSGTPEKVLDNCRQSIKEAEGMKGCFALMPGCDVPAFSSPVNVYQMTKASLEFGRYI